MTGKRKRSLRMADGGVLPPARPVSPFSLRGIGQGLAGAYDGAVGAASTAIETVAKPFTRPAGYTPASAVPVPVAAPEAPPVAAPPQLGGMNLGVIQRREAAAGLRDGTAFLEGPGGPTDDKIDAKLSRGEAVLPADTVQAVGPENIQGLIDATHTPVKKKGLRHFANGVAGIEVFEPFDPVQRARVPEPKIPGMEVTYGNGGVADPGPGNPNVNRVGPQRPPMAPTAPAAPVAVAEPAPLATKAAGGLRNFVTGGSGDIGTAVRNVGGAAGTAAKTVLRGNAALAAPVATLDGFTTDTEQYAKRFGLEDTQPGVMRDLGIRALGVASDVGNAMTFGQAGRLFRDKQDAPAGAVPAAAPATAPAAAPATQTDVQRSTAPPLKNDVLPGGAQAGSILRRGNSFTNTGSFIEDQRSGGPSATDIAAADRVAARSTQGLRGGAEEPNLPAGYGVTIPRSEAVQEREARNASVRSTLDDAGMSNRQKLAREQSERANATQREIASMRDSTERRGQDLTNEGFARRDKVTLRGQDLNFEATTRGQDVTARSAAARARQDAMQSDRQFSLEVAKYGHERAKTNFEQREKATKNVHDQITNMIPNGPDGKPDTQTAARYSTALNAALSNYQSALEKRAAQGDQRAAQELQNVQERGMAALDARDIRTFINGMKTKDLAEASHTGPLNPFGGTAVISDEPVTSMRKTDEGLFGFGGEYTTNRGDKIPARMVERDGSFFGGQRRVDLRDMIR